MDRLAELKAEAARLNARIAELETQQPAPPPPARDEGVRILQVLDERGDPPNLKEMEKLYSAVRNLSPWPEMLRDRFDDGRPFRGFASAFRWLQNVPRTDRPNGKRALSYWNDCCKNWLRDRNCMTSDLSANALILACFACGDISYCPGDPTLGVVWEIGISEHVGRPADPTGWRRILKEGAAAVLPPSSPARRMAAPSNVRVTVGY